MGEIIALYAKEGGSLDSLAYPDILKAVEVIITLYYRDPLLPSLPSVV